MSVVELAGERRGSVGRAGRGRGVRVLRLGIVASSAVAAAIVIAPASPAAASGIVVTTTADTIDAAASCPAVTIAALPGPDAVTSLREAVCAANSTAGSDQITFSVNGTFLLTGAANEDNGNSADLDVKQSLDIVGNGTGNTVIDGSSIERIFDVFPSSAVTFSLSNLTLQHGDTRTNSFKEGGVIYLHNNVTTTLSGVLVQDNFSGANGAIENRGTLTISNSVIVDNNTLPASGSVAGGGLHTAGATTITDSTFTNNTVRGEGGGIAATVANGVTVSITGSTLSGNAASVTGGGLGNGGGISTTGNQGVINITNSTISGNRADNSGGGTWLVTPVAGTGNVTLRHVTVAENVADNDNNASGTGGGISQTSAAVTLRNTIVARNWNSTTSFRDDISGAMSALSVGSLVGDGTGFSGISNGVNGNQVGTGVTPIDPLLLALANNGGPTQTHALAGASPAIGNGDDASCLATDQRGTGRPAVNCDIGAFEFPPTDDLEVTKAVNNSTPNVGDLVTFTVTVINHGADPATGIEITDVLPVGLGFVSATPSQGSYNSITGLWSVGSLAGGTSATAILSASVNSPAPQTNTATVTAADQFDPDTGNNTDSVTVTPQLADLALAKSVSNSTPNVGDTVTFTVTLGNNVGSDTATGVKVTDLLPAGLNLVTATPSQGTYDSGTGVWNVGTVTTVTPQTLQVVAAVASTGAKTNTATISAADQFDPNTGNNSASATVTPQQADLALTKDVDNPTPNVGDQVTFTVTLTNFGPDTATGVQVTDLLPAGLTFVSANPSQGSYTSGTGVWNVGTLTTPATLGITATVMTPSPLTNAAAITHADQFDPITGNNTATASTTAEQSELALTKTVDDLTPNVGDQVTFTVTLTNNGPDPATGVKVTDALPAGLTFVNAIPDQGSYASGTGLWDVGTVASAASPKLELIATVMSPASQTNTAIADADQFDPNTGNNSASATVTPQQADLALIKTVNDPTPNVGDQATFTVTLTNSGPDTATHVHVTDLLPAGLTMTGAATTSQGTYDSVTGVWDVGAVTTVTPATLALTATVVSGLPRTNTATITHADQFDTNTGNNSASATVTPRRADLALTKSVSNATPNVGDQVTFTVTLTNNGPDTATGVELDDLLPNGFTFVSATASQGSYTPGVGALSVGTLAMATPATLQVTATVTSPLTMTNTATIASAAQFDPDTTNNSASVTVAAQQADLSLTKTVDNATPNLGDQVTFAVTATNGGPDTATNVQVTDLLPAGLSFVSATPSQGTYTTATGVWVAGSITTATPATLQLTATVVSTASQTNTATVTAADQFDPDPTENTASATVTARPADLALTKTVSNPTPNVGDQVTFTVTVTNAGPAPATAVQVSDALPAGLSLVSATASQGTYASGVWSVGTITTATPASLTLTAKVVSSAAQTNTATVTAADQADPNTANNAAAAAVTPQQADLALKKTVSNTTPTVGNQISFTVTLTNAGPSSATGVRVSDALPAGLTLVSATPSQGTFASGVWDVGTLAVGTPAMLTVTATVGSPGALTNTAQVSAADQFDPTSTNNAASATITAQQPTVVLPPTGASSASTLRVALEVMLSGLVLYAAAAWSRRRRLQGI